MQHLCKINHINTSERADCTIGVGRFRILWGSKVKNIGGGGANSQQAHDVVLTSMRRNDVAPTSFRRHVPARFFNKSVPSNYISHLKI